MKLGILRKPFTYFHETLRKIFSILDYFIWFLFDFSKLKKIKNKKIKKILIVLINQKLGNIGGDFCTLGVINCFKKNFPYVSLFMLSDSKTIKQFKDNPNVTFIDSSKKGYFSKIKKQSFDALIAMNMGQLSIKKFTFIPYRVSKTSLGINNLIKIKNKFSFTRKVHNSFNCHMVSLRFRMFESLGFKFKNKNLIFYSPKKEERKVHNFLRKNKLKKFIVIHPGGKHVVDSYKKGLCPPHLWSLKNYAEVADYFSKKGYKVLITGSKPESLLAEEIKKRSSHKIINACGKLSIVESGTILKKAKLLIATDTSIVHVAYQVRVPIVELMGPSIPEVVGAWPLNSPKHKILIDNGRCSRSMKKISCPENIPCLKNIKVQQVIDASNNLLKKY